MALDIGLTWQAGWNLLTQGSVVEAAIQPFTNYLGVFFYLLIAFMGMMMIYMKWGDFNSTVITGLIILSAMLPFVAAMEGIGQVTALIEAIVVLAIAAVLYKLLYKGG